MTAQRSSAANLGSLAAEGKRLLRRGAYEAKSLVARYPALALPIARRRHGVPVDERTRIVIEGFPRTGTSFAVAAFDLAQDGGVPIACHVHAPAQILEGIRRGLPVVAVVREPEDTVLSFMIRNPHLEASTSLRGYLRFYEPLRPHLGRIVVGTFPQVTADMGAVIRRVNERFGTGFASFEPTEDNVRRCFEAIEADYRKRLPEGEALEREVARPSAWRRERKEELRAAYRSPSTARLRARAERVFQAFADAAGTGDP
ncbi:MAG TPA: hypothetical protein VE646_09585 [Actinomycetota bacterium]|nr:hypothetical protein [Actinomycetota bacterium]